MKNILLIISLFLPAFCFAQKRDFARFVKQYDETFLIYRGIPADTLPYYTYEPQQMSIKLTIVYDKKTNLAGAMDFAGDIVVPCEYESLTIKAFDLFEAKKNGKTGLLNLKNQVIIPFEYDSFIFSALLEYYSPQNVPNYLDLVRRFGNYSVNWNTILATKQGQYQLINFRNEFLGNLAPIYNDTITIEKTRYLFQMQDNRTVFLLKPLVSSWMCPKLIDVKTKNKHLYLQDLAGKSHEFTDTMYYYITDSIMAIGDVEKGFRLYNIDFQPITKYYNQISPLYEEDKDTHVGNLFVYNPKPKYIPPPREAKHPKYPSGHALPLRFGFYATPFTIFRPSLKHFLAKEGENYTYLNPAGKPFEPLKEEDIAKLGIPNLKVIKDKKTQKQGLSTAGGELLIPCEYEYIFQVQGSANWIGCVKNDVTCEYYNTHSRKKANILGQKIIYTSDDGIVLVNDSTGIVFDSLGNEIDHIRSSKLSISAAVRIENASSKEFKNVWNQQFKLIENSNYIDFVYLKKPYWAVKNKEEIERIVDSSDNIITIETGYKDFRLSPLTQIISATNRTTENPMGMGHWLWRNEKIEKLPIDAYLMEINNQLVMGYYFSTNQYLWGFINLKQPLLTLDTSRFKLMRPERKGCIIYKNEAFYSGILNSKFEEITPPIYDRIFDFTELGLAKMTRNGKSGFVNTAGKVVIQPIYDAIFPPYFNSIPPLPQGNPYGLQNGVWQEIKLK